MARSIGKGLRRLGAGDLEALKGTRSETIAERHYVRGLTPRQTAVAMGVQVQDVEQMFATLEVAYRQLDDTALRVRAIKILMRSEHRSALLRRVVAHFKRAGRWDLVAKAASDERAEDQFQLDLLMKYLVRGPSSDDGVAGINQMIERTLNDAMQGTSEVTEQEREMTISLRSIMRVLPDGPEGVGVDWGAAEES